MSSAPDFTIVEGDTSPSWEMTLTGADGQPLDLRGATVVLRFALLDGTGTVKTRQATIVDPLVGEVRIDWQAGDTTTPGAYDAELAVTPSQPTTPASRPLSLYIRPKVGDI